MWNHYISTVKKKAWYTSGNIWRHTPHAEYENFVTAHAKAATECIRTIPKGKWRGLCEVIVISEKLDHMKKSILSKKPNKCQYTEIFLKNPEKTNAYHKKIQLKSKAKSIKSENQLQTITISMAVIERSKNKRAKIKASRLQK